MLFLAKCYGNLAIVLSFSGGSKKDIDHAIEQDFKIKAKYGVKDDNYIRALNNYTAIITDSDFEKACDLLIELSELKKEKTLHIHECEKLSEYISSWATTIFNIGLLARDMDLYEIAHKYVCIANKMRFKTISLMNKDYCSSLNVCSEIELFTEEKQNLYNLIKSIESRNNLPEGFTTTLWHTWYICAFYHYLQGDFKNASKYISKSIANMQIKGELIDFRIFRIHLLHADIKFAKSRKTNNTKFDNEIYLIIIKDIIKAVGKDSYYLVSPYKKLINATEDLTEKQRYQLNLDRLLNIHEHKNKCIETKLIDYLSRVENG